MVELVVKDQPRQHGNTTIFVMLHIMAATSISISSPASNRISSGVMMGASNVEAAVMVTDNARLAFAM